MTISKSGFNKYLKNTLWLFMTYGVRLFTGFFVGLWLARYLGPTEYGIYNYVISLTSIFITIATFGTTEIIVKKLLSDPAESNVNLKSGFDLRMLLSLILYIILGAYAYFFEKNSDVQMFIFISSTAIFFQPFEVVESFFRARVLARKSSISRMVQLCISAIGRILLIVYRAPLTWFYLLFVFDSIFYAMLMLWSYLKENPNFLNVRASSALTKEIFKESFPLMIIAVTTLMLARFDLVIIGKLLDQKEVGLYSAASKTIEIGTLFAVIVCLSLYPAILNSKKTDPAIYAKRMAMLNRLLTAGGGGLTALVFAFAEPITLLLFGNEFVQSANILRILSFNILFVSFGQVSFRWYLSENLQTLMMYKTILAVVFNIVLNFLLIPRMGILGSAFGSILTSLIFHFLFEGFFARTRECFKINTSFLRIS